MAKFLKVVKIIFICLAVILGVGYVVLNFINPELAKQVVDTVVDYANRPLPIVGVSAVVLAVLVWKIFERTGYGKRAIAQMKKEYEEQKEKDRQELERKKIEYSAIICFYEQEMDLLFNGFIQLCDYIPNKKVKEFGGKLKNDYAVIRQELREKMANIMDNSVEVLVKSKEELVSAMVEVIKKEMVDKYGEEGQKALESIAKAEKI